MGSVKVAVTIYDIAREAQLSHATVSMALRNLPRIKAETRERIQKLAADMGYMPNQAAVSLKVGHSKQVALVLPRLDVTNQYSLIETFKAQCTPDGYQVVLLELPADAEGQRQTFEHIVQNDYAAVAAYLSCFQTVAPAIERLLATQRPLVVIGPPQDMETHPGLFTVQVDNLTAVQAGLRMLLSQGHRHIAHTVSGDNDSANNQSHQIILQTLREYGVTDWDPAFVCRSRRGEGMIEDGYRAARTLFECKPRVTAIQCQNDLLAFGLLRGLQELGAQVPKDISVIGSDNMLIAEYNHITLTSIDMRQAESAQAAWQLLLHQLEKPDWDHIPNQVLLKANLVVRESTGAAPAKPFSLR